MKNLNQTSNIQNPGPLKGLKLLVAACGSIAAIKTPLLVSELVKAGADVRCLITPSASHFVSPLALSTLSRNRCYQDKDQWDPKESRPLHIALAEWADIIVIAPLSANSLGKWVHGFADSLLASVLLASESPVIAAAAMNTSMWENDAVMKNWTDLDNHQKVIKLNPSKGLLACDRIGEGKMVSTEIIHLAIQSAALSKNHISIKKDLIGINFLVTAGPTIENLDQARQITNKSSGRMGVLLGQAARLRGANVDLIHGPLEIPLELTEGLNVYKISEAAEMQKILIKLQSSADIIAMSAAVSDFRKKGISASKKLNKHSFIESLKNELEIVPDLLSELTARKKSTQIILGFSALTGNDENIKEIGQQKRISKGCDLLLANPIDRINQGFGNNPNGGFLLGPKNFAIKIDPKSKFELANELIDQILDFKSKFF